MKKAFRKILILLCSVLFVMCTAFAVACGARFTIDLKEPTRPYRVGDSVNCYDFVTRQADVVYEFSVTDTTGEKAVVKGQTYYVATAGTYTLDCKATKGTDTAEDSVLFEVKETQPFVAQYGTVDIALGSRLTNSMLLRRMNLITLSETVYEQYVTSVQVFKDFGTESVTYAFTEGGSHRYYDNGYHLFLDEGKYIYHYVIENAGGIKERDVIVEVRENFLQMREIENKVVYDETTKTVTWLPVENATYYRVKVDEKIVDVPTGTSLDISSHFVGDFQYFQLEVAVVDKDERRLGKLVGPYVQTSPAGFESVVLSAGSTVNQDTRTVTMSTDKIWGRAKSHVDETEKEYVSFYGNYGVGTYVDFTFKGNNMPIVRFFANDIDGYLTNWADGDSTTNGVVFMGGFDSYGGGVHAPQLKNYRVYGPNALVNGYLDNAAAEMRVKLAYDEFPLLTMQGLMDNEYTEFKYTVGTYEDAEDHSVIAHIMLSQKTEGAWVEVYNNEFDLKIQASECKAGNIVAISPIKSDSATFTFSQPYEYEKQAEPSANMYSFNTTYLADNKVLMRTKAPSSRTVDSIDAQQNAYIAFKGDYGVGTYLDFEFKGNNLPSVRFFANKVNGNFTNAEAAGTAGNLGLLFMSGLATQETLGKENPKYNHTKLFYIAPNMLTHRFDLTKAIGAVAPSYTQPAYTMNSLKSDENAEYKYTAGTFRDDDGTVVAVCYLYKKVNNAWTIVANTAWDTDRAVEEWEAIGGNIVVLGSVKGYGTTTFTFSQPYQKTATDSDLVGNRAVWDNDGNVTLYSKKIINSSKENIDKGEHDTSFIAYTGDYGVGTYLDFEFTGNNMPQVRFFANSVDGLITKYEDDAPATDEKDEIKTWQYSLNTKGLLFTNGCVSNQDPIDNYQNTFLRVYYDMLSNGWHGYPASDPNGGCRIDPTDKTFMEKLGMSEFVKKADTEFKYTVGTYADTDGTTMVHVILQAKIDGVWTEICNETQDTNKPTTDYGAGSIVILSAMKGANETTVFKCSRPYVKQ